MFQKNAVRSDDVALVAPKLRQDEFDYAYYEHVNWVRTGGVEGKRASFRDVDMRDVSMRGVDMSYASFRGANMQGVDLSYSILQEADLTDVKMNGANASGCNFFRANLTGAKAQSANFSEAYMASAQCMNADFSEADFSKATLRDAVLRSADFSAANLTHADMGLAVCRGTVFNYAIFDGASMQQADMRDAQMRHAVLSRAKLHGAQFKDARLDGVSLLEVDFSVAHDVAPEYQAQLIEQARQMIAAERDIMMSDKVRLLQEENALKEMKIHLENSILQTSKLRASQDFASKTLIESGAALKRMAWVWFAMFTAYVSVVTWIAKDIPFENLHIQEASAVILVLCFVMGMLIKTASLCSRTANMMISRATLAKD
jgi:uncharacterized protein YjbI with pentapeptide repeats